jgi:hypothetical protein
MQWRSIEDAVSTVGGQGPVDATGISFYVEGEARRRPGMTQLTANGGIALGAFRSPLNGAWLLIAKASGAIEAVSV